MKKKLSSNLGGIVYRNLTIKHNGVTYVPKRMAKGYSKAPQLKKA